MITYDTTTPYSPHYPLSKSFALFESLLFRHSVSRPPHSTLVFNRSDVQKILQFTTDQYYRLWRVFKVACCPKRQIMKLKQVGSCDVEGTEYYSRVNRGLDKAEEEEIVVTFPEPVEEEEEEEEEEEVVPGEEDGEEEAL